MSEPRVVRIEPDRAGLAQDVFWSTEGARA